MDSKWFWAVTMSWSKCSLSKRTPIPCPISGAGFAGSRQGHPASTDEAAPPVHRGWVVPIWHIIYLAGRTGYVLHTLHHGFLKVLEAPIPPAPFLQANRYPHLFGRRNKSLKCCPRMFFKAKLVTEMVILKLHKLRKVKLLTITAPF